MAGPKAKCTLLGNARPSLFGWLHNLAGFIALQAPPSPWTDLRMRSCATPTSAFEFLVKKFFFPIPRVSILLGKVWPAQRTRISLAQPRRGNCCERGFSLLPLPERVQILAKMSRKAGQKAEEVHSGIHPIRTRNSKILVVIWGNYIQICAP